jgi:hypothetical protein
MQYVKGVCLPLPLGGDPNLWYPVTQGDEACILEVGNPIELEDLLTILEEGDSVVSDAQEIDELEEQYADRFIRRPTYWAGEGKLEFCPE